VILWEYRQFRISVIIDLEQKIAFIDMVVSLSQKGHELDVDKAMFLRDKA
jgi:hypothetical protein